MCVPICESASVPIICVCVFVSASLCICPCICSFCLYVCSYVFVSVCPCLCVYIHVKEKQAASSCTHNAKPKLKTQIKDSEYAISFHNKIRRNVTNLVAGPECICRGPLPFEEPCNSPARETILPRSYFHQQKKIPKCGSTRSCPSILRIFAYIPKYHMTYQIALSTNCCISK